MQVRKYKKEGLKYVHSKVVVLLDKAFNHGGIAFGGYVRDVFPKIAIHDFSSIEIKDVDIWFIDDGARERFIEECPDLVLIYDDTSFDGSKAYHVVDSYGDVLFSLDLTVSTEFPVSDFDVNTLCWNPVKKNFFCGNHSCNTSELLFFIRQRKMNITDEYYQDIISEEYKRERVVDRFVNKGWSIYYEERELKITSEKVKSL